VLVLCVAAALGGACWGGRSLDQIRELQEDGLHDQVEAPLRALLADAPDDPELNYRLGLALARTGRPSEAVFPLRKAGRSEEFAVQAGQLLAAILLETRNYDESIREADALIARDPADHAAWFVRGRGAEQIGRYELALESADAILAARPEDLDALALRGRSLAYLKRFAEAEATYRQIQRAGAADPQRAAAACLSLALFLGEKRKDPKAATRVAEECLSAHREDPLAAEPAAAVYDAIGRKEEGTRIVRETLARGPENHEVRALLAQRLVDSGELAEAEAVLLDGIDRASGAERWISVAEVRRRRGDLEGALLAVEQALGASPNDPDTLHFAAAELLFELGRTDEAEARMRQVKEPAYRLVLEGRLVLERGDAKRALEILTRAIEQWPGNAGARIQAARAANQLGDLERAKSELREATRGAPRDTDAALLLARLYLLEGDTENAAAFLSRHYENRGFATPDAYLLAARTLAAAGDPQEARRLLAQLRNQEGRAGLAVGALAELAASKQGPAAAVREVEGSGLDLAAPENEPALRAWLAARLALGETAAAAAKLEALVAEHPDRPGLLALRGQTLLAAGDLDGAEQAFDAALSLYGEHAPAEAGKGWVALRRGDAAAAVIHLERAAAWAPENADIGYGAAQARLASGDETGAVAALEKLLRVQPEHAASANELAFLLARRGESLDLALRLAERAARLAPSPEVSDTLGFVRWRRGETQQARSALEAALAERPDYATARYHLALVQKGAGDDGAARASLERALAGAPFPEADEARLLLEQLRASAGG
jgi:tetratricopeptide (TPR) repeat protein